ncbi:MAG: 1-phosphofructokinase family hexose kinase [Promethearchaeota archaeon]
MILGLFNPTIDRILKIDNFKPNGTYKVEDNKEHVFSLGKSISVALTISKLAETFATVATGENLELIAFIGENEISLYNKFLNSKKIKHHLIPVKGKTRSNITILDPTNETTTHIRFQGFKVNDDKLLEMKKTIENIINQDDFAIFSGSFPPGMPPNYIANYIAPIIQKKGVKLIVDTSGPPLNYLIDCMPFFIKLNIAETNQILKLKLINQADAAGKSNVSTVATNMFFANTFEELEYQPTHKILRSFATEILNNNKILEAFKKGLKFYILTLGKYGSLYISPKKLYYSYINIEKSYYNVGCGDAFLGGLVYGLKNNFEIVKCLKLATACGAANTQTLGAGIIKKDIILKYFKQVKIENIRLSNG